MVAAFHTRLKYRLDNLERSTGWLARHVGVSKSTASNWTHGRSTPSLSRLNLIARELRCPVAWLLGELPLEMPLPY